MAASPRRPNTFIPLPVVILRFLRHALLGIYGVQSFATKYNKTGKLVCKFCPELAKFPNKEIYSPHLAPPEVQKKAECTIDRDYPLPMLDDNLEKERCVLRIKAS